MSRAIIKRFGRLQTEEAWVNLGEHTLELNDRQYDINQLAFAAPIAGMIYGTQLNYKGALTALGGAVNEAPYMAAPKAPILYIKPANTIAANGARIPLPDDVPKLAMGAALGVVIGHSATRVCESEALDYVAGYTVVNDVSIPHASVYRPAIAQQARDGFCPIGPWVIERDAVADPDALGVRVFINGELRQKNTTANLIRSVTRLLVDVTDFMTLNPGDVLLVGVPEDAPLAGAGDQVRIEIDEVGWLENTVVPERDWMKEGAV
ncbi:5-carboxy-2-oxohept-3-enedioate decarboxylase HpaG1 subunit [Aneurinibacillus soli]|uniref:Homoprotocatechuate catabolism bifunctional isomerase/decarboxylase n=1 Tax=Aneurinibacillus soli TaxID=1500254 RepID=A0A0U4NHR8_9BACL|nr:fumarylacetoacetate hydrolase family protein [Aneurinibacillus soli]PYE64343.1 5-carboxy-2-oxohept-3-enedioate decarboxylase HpaG1 subunit [Aneurinibacillus soli]BAU28292.1 Homoprotocatechuate catabolism bifunctional isomerase/decarboxylase [Aneurinibacillus soli]